MKDVGQPGKASIQKQQVESEKDRENQDVDEAQ